MSALWLNKLTNYKNKLKCETTYFPLQFYLVESAALRP